MNQSIDDITSGVREYWGGGDEVGRDMILGLIPNVPSVWISCLPPSASPLPTAAGKRCSDR